MAKRVTGPEIEKLIQIMEERYRIGDKLFDIILNKTPKIVPPV